MPDPGHNTYADGVRDGRILALEDRVTGHDRRLDAHAQRLQWVERVIYAVVGAYGFIQLLPVIKTYLGFG